MKKLNKAKAPAFAATDPEYKMNINVSGFRGHSKDLN